MDDKLQPNFHLALTVIRFGISTLVGSLSNFADTQVLTLQAGIPTWPTRGVVVRHGIY